MRAFALAFGFITVVGFYGYVLLALYRERKRLRTHEKRLRGMRVTRPRDLPQRASQSQIADPVRKQALLSIGVAIGGLVGLFAEIELLSRLISSPH